MRFVASEWLWGAAFALCVAVVLIVQGVRLARDKKRFGDPELIDNLVTSKTSIRRTVRGVLLTLAVALAAVAAAGPQYGQGTRVLPATNLDVILVLDYSKSMYARDVSPSRIERAKIEVSRLVHELAGARFGAVAFAGETLSFPLTSDGAAIAQFFRGLSPHDMPVGGTAIARALMAGKELLARDPLSERHERVMILVTDGEDLEGDPVRVAEEIGAEDISIEVVQIGGRSPEPIPKIDENGREVGLRRDENGRIMTTQLSPEGEADLRRIAEVTGGQVLQADKGQVGIDAVTKRLRRQMTEELSERVETVFADVYHYPLGAVVLLLVLEAFIGLAPKRKVQPEPPRGTRSRRRPRRMQKTAILLALLALGCNSFDQLFERNSPVVDEAISALETGEQKRAIQLLTEYLETGPCEAGVIGAGERARRLGNASLDLALALAGPFPRPPKTSEEDEAEATDQGPSAPARDTQADPNTPSLLPPQGQAPPGQPGAGIPGMGMPGLSTPGTTDPGAPGAKNPEKSAQIDCALRLLSPVAENSDHSAELRARALYLMGNLELSRGAFEVAVDSYDRALLFAPGLPEGEGDAIGRDIARNRALALRLQKQKEQQQKEQDQKSNTEDQQKSDESKDQKDEKKKQDKESKDGEKKQDERDRDEQEGEKKGEKKREEEKKNRQKPGEDQQKSPQEQKDQGQQTPKSSEQQEKRKQQDKQQAAKPAASQDARILDRLEQAPTLQQHNAKQRAQGIPTRPTMEDK